jgi:hypothetical protein
MIGGPSSDAYVAQRLNTFLSDVGDDESCVAVTELLQYFKQHPPKAVADSPELRCAVTVDTGDDCLLEVFASCLTPEWRSRTTFAVYSRLSAVVRMLQEAAPTVVVGRLNAKNLPRLWNL